MKRSPTLSPSPPSPPLITPKAEAEAQDDYSPSPSPSPTQSKSKTKSQLNLKAGPTAPPAKRQRSTPAPTPVRVQGPWSTGWSSDKKEAIIERYLTLGIKGSNVNDIAREVCPSLSSILIVADEKFNSTKAQLTNAIQVGQKNNLRDKAAKSVR
jgi:hypothetical protein